MTKKITKAIIKERGKSIYIGEQEIETSSDSEIIVKNLFSSVNFKDNLVSQIQTGITRLKKIIPGIDLICEYDNKVYAVIGQNIGIERNGGWAENTVINKNWLQEIPFNISPFEAAGYGTSGLTAASVVKEILKNHKSRDEAILVRGATTSVGFFCVVFLLNYGFKVETISRSEIQLKHVNLLTKYSEIEFIEKFNTPIGRKKWLSVIDLLGGQNVSIITKNLQSNGSCYLVGNILGNQVDKISLIPFVTNGCSLIGICLEEIIKNDPASLWSIISSLHTETKKHMTYNIISMDELTNELGFLKNGFGIRNIIGIK